MLKTILICCAMSFMTTLHSQTYFSKKFPIGLAGMSINVLPNGYLMTCNLSGSDTWMIRTDSLGNEIHRRNYAFSCNRPDLTLLDENRIFMGATGIVSNDTSGTILAKLNTNGDTIWTKGYRKTGCIEEVVSIVKSHDDNLVIASLRYNDATRQRDLLVYKIDTLGSLLSEKVLLVLNKPIDWTSMRYSNNEYYFSFYYSFDRLRSDEDGAVIKTDTNFVRTFYKNFLGKGTFATVSHSAYYLPTSNKQSTFVWLQDSINTAWQHRSQTNTAIYYLDSLGERKSSYYFFDTVFPSCTRTAESVRTMRNGDILGVGKLSSSCTDGKLKGWIFRMSPNGKLKWQRYITDTLYYPSFPYVWFLDFKETPNGDLIISGFIIGTNPQFHPLLIKVDSNGCFDNRRCDSADVKVSINSVYDKKQQIRLFPNPVVDQLNIDFDQMNGENQAEISLFNLLGSKVGQQKLDRINTPLSINVSNLPSGMYNAVLQIRGRSPAVQKFVIVR